MIDTIFSFYAIGIPLLIGAGIVWYWAFNKNYPQGYLGAVFGSMVLLSIMFFWGIKTTKNTFDPERAEFLILIGVPGFTGIFMSFVTLAFIFHKLKKL